MAEVRLLVKVRGTGEAFAGAAVNSLGASSVEVEKVMTVPPPPGQGFGADVPQATWLGVRLKNVDSDNPWDHAHAALPGGPFGLDVGHSGVDAIEPDFQQQWLSGDVPGGTALAPGVDACAFEDQEPKGGQPLGPGVGWNFTDAYSQTATARSRFGAALGEKLDRITIAHLDTGYDPGHVTLPARLNTLAQRSFVDGDDPMSAVDQTPPGQSTMSNRGHGTATLALLAGNKLKGNSPGWGGFADYIGGAPLARVIPIRIADWVVRFTTSTMVKGFDYARQNHAHVLSMSMGGLSSSALTDAVNAAYDAGMVLVTAAGNNISGMPLPPSSTVFPARYRRVLAACGLMADGSAYTGLDSGTMQGDSGPPSKMTTALGAYTPNVPRAKIGCGTVVDMNGAGTSYATPQIAAAAALWLAQHFETVGQYPEPWMRIEAVRLALFAAAAKTTPKLNAAEAFARIGQGVLKIDAALAIRPAPAATLQKLPPAEASWSWLDFLTGGGVSVAAQDRAAAARSAMFALELTQMAQTSAEVAASLEDPDVAGGAQLPTAYLRAALDYGNPSRPLKAMLERLLGRPAMPAAMLAGAAPAAETAPPPWKRKEPPFPNRRLRVYALDPSVAKSLDFVAVNETTLSILWEKKLEPGPVGEYIEVVDVDPASNRIYDPVDLNQPQLLAQDGLPPSEGNPAFHQQMVYAVGMTTIGHFERALGRRALWAPRTIEGQGEKFFDVPRLRIYPHALRDRNAYYSPDKKALLFGYFPAASLDGDATAPGSMVFACLSSDIVAHEMSHALLDGLHRHFQEASNPDVPAFHEAFADIVALFQHFALPDLVRFAVAQARGKLSADNLLGGLARQFGEGTGRQGPLRNYVGPDIAKFDYAATTEVHDRGSILVFAVYEAFLRIVERRTADLIRIATNGTGVLPEGALHPNLVDRLAREASKAAEQVLHICIRALDYCPAVDLTFGEYLRALITADRDLVPDDILNYRVAFMESFRKRGILPNDVRTVSEESLAWGTTDNPRPDWLKRVIRGLDLGWDRALDRTSIQKLNEDNRWKVWKALKEEFGRDARLGATLGLVPGVPRYDDTGKVVHGTAPGQTTFAVLGVRPARRISPVDGSFNTEVIVTIQQRQKVLLDDDNPGRGFFWFRGGATLILDTRRTDPMIRYVIVKNGGSTARLQRQRQTAAQGFVSPLRALYFGGANYEPFALMHAENIGGAQ